MERNPLLSQLPDIDNSGQEIYSYDGVEDRDYTPTNEPEELGEETKQNISKAFETFRRRDVFSNESLRRAYADASNVPKEPPKARLKRLQMEINELSKEVKASDIEASQSSDADPAENTEGILENLQQLENQLSELSRTEGYKLYYSDEKSATSTRSTELQRALSSRLQSQIEAAKQQNVQKGANKQQVSSTSTTNDDDNRIEYELYVYPEQARQEAISRTLDIEERIAKIEKAIGLSGGNTVTSSGIASFLNTGTSNNSAGIYGDGPSESLFETILRIDQQLKLLDNESLDKIQKRVNTINQEIDATMSSQNAPQLARVDALFDAVQRWDSVIGLVPHIISRLKTLKTVHNEAINFSDALSSLNKQQQSIQTMLNSQSSSLEDVQKSFKQNVEILEQNTSEFDSRIAKLEEKINKLEQTQ